jgi:hypothetical protein
MFKNLIYINYGHQNSNELGEISFIGILLVLMSISLWSLFILNNMKTLNQLRERTHKHLCFKFLYVSTDKYQARIAHLNKVIKASYYLSLVPASRVHAQMAMRTAQISQNIIFVSYMKNIFTSKFCSLTSPYQFIRNSPYQRVKIFSFKRRQNGTTILKKTKWSFTYHFFLGDFREERIILSYNAKTSTQSPKSKVSHLMSLDTKLSKLRYGLPLF